MSGTAQFRERNIKANTPPINNWSLYFKAAGIFIIDDGGIETQLNVPTDGDVVGPASSTDNAIPRFNGTTGKILQDSGVILDGSNNVSGFRTVDTTDNITIDKTGAGAILTLQSDGTSGNKVIGVYPNSSPADITFGEYEIFVQSNTAGSEDGKLLFRTSVNGSLDLVGQFDHQGHFLVGATALNVNGVNDTVGIGTVPISSTFLVIDAGTTVKSQINFVDGVHPTSPNVGDLTREGDSLFFEISTGPIDLAAHSGGDVTGPASVTDNNLVRFDGTTGKIIQAASQILIDDSANVSGFRDLSLEGTAIIMDTGVASAATLTLRSASTAVGGVITLAGHDSGGNDTDYARIRGLANDATDGSEDGKILLQVLKSNVETTNLEIQEETVIVHANASNLTQLKTASLSNSAGTDFSHIIFQAKDSGGSTDVVYNRIDAKIITNTPGSEDAEMEFNLIRAGSLANVFKINNTAFNIFSSDFTVNGTTLTVGNTDVAVGIGQATNSAHFLGIAAATTVKAQINFTDGVAPTSPNEGDIFKVGDALFFRQAGASVDLTIGTKVGSLAFEYRATTTTQTPPPASGRIIWDNATQASSANLHFHKTPDAGPAIGNFLLNLVMVGSNIVLFDNLDTDDFQHWTVDSITDNTTYVTYGVTLVTSNKSFSNNERIIALFTADSAAGGSGDVTGPGSATNNAISRFDGTTGKIIQNSGILIDDSDQLIDAASISAGDGLTSSAGTDANHLNILVGTNATAETNGISFYETNATPTAFAMHLGYDGTGTGDDNFIAFYDSDGDVIMQFLNGETIQLALGTDINEFSLDGTFAGNSNNAVPTENSVKEYVDDHEGNSGKVSFVLNSTISSAQVMSVGSNGNWNTNPMPHEITDASEVNAIGFVMGSTSASSSGDVTITLREESSALGSAHALNGGTAKGSLTFSFVGSTGSAFYRNAEVTGLSNSLTQGNNLFCDVSTKSASVALTDIHVIVTLRNT